MENTQPLNTSSKKMGMIIKIAVGIILISVASYFLYEKYETNKKNTEEQERQNQVKTFYQKVYDTKVEFIPLTEDEYGLLLQNPLVNPPMEGSKSVTVNNITIGLKEFANSGEIEVALPYIPNLPSKESVFVRFDSIKDSNGNEIFDKSSGFEAENDMFTDLDLEKRNINGVPYLYGTRSLHLTRDIASKYISEIKGKLVVTLPIGVRELSLSSTDIDIEKPFAGNYITLKEIKDDGIVIHFTGDIKDVLKYQGIDAEGGVIDSGGYSCSNDICDLFIKNAKSIRLWDAERKIKKEIPFTFTQTTDPEPEDAVAKEDLKVENTTVAPSVKPNPKTAVKTASVTAEEKEAVIKAYFDFKKILETNDPDQLMVYSKKVYPSRIAQLDAEYAKQKPTQVEYTMMVSFVKGFLGYDILA